MCEFICQDVDKCDKTGEQAPRILEMNGGQFGSLEGSLAMARKGQGVVVASALSQDSE